MPIARYGARWSSRDGVWKPYAPYECPPVVYKYRDFDANGYRILRDRAIFYASPSQLNDPLDCRIDVREHFEQAMSRFPENTRTGQLFRALAKASITRVAGGASIPLHESFNETLTSGGLFCVSSALTEPMMWAHYANGHRGFCLGFDRWYVDWLRTQLATHKIAGFGPVAYTTAPDLTSVFFEMLPLLREFETDTQKHEWIKDYAQAVIVEVLSTKAKTWRYEKEYRSMRTEPGPVPFPPHAIKEVVFGVASRKENQDELRKLLSGAEWAHVRYRTVSFAPRQFDLVVKDVE
jgi:hypothetical protein